MNIKTDQHSNEEIINGEIDGSKAQIIGRIKFKKYDYNKNTSIIIGTKPTESDLFFCKTDVLNEVYSVGKKLYRQLEDKLKEVHVEYREKINELNDEPQIENFVDSFKPKSPLNNSFINNFLPEKILKDERFSDSVIKTCLEYCQQNGFPVVNDNNSEYIEDNLPEEYYYFNIHSFVTLSILIYIIYELQNGIREILEFTSGKSLNGQTVRTMFGNNNFYYIDEYLDIIYRFAWLFNMDSKDKYDLSLLDISEELINIMNRIQLTTTYLQYGTVNTFDPEYKKFSVLETHTNVMSIAWEKLKLAMFPYAGGIVKKCKKCGRIFEAETNATAYCSEECKQERYKINSNNSYNKLRNLHLTLCKLYNTVNKSKFSLLDKDVKKNIITYTSLDISALKKIKDKNKIKNMEKYIEALKICNS